MTMRLRFERFCAHLAEMAVERRWTVLLLSLLFAALTSSGMCFLKMNDDYRAFFDSDDPELAAYTRLQSLFTKNEYIVFALAPESGNVFEPEILDAIEDLTKEAWKLAYSIRVDSLTNFPYAYSEDDLLVVEPIFENATEMSRPELARRETVALAEPQLLNALVSPSGHVAGVVVTYQLPEVARTEGIEAAFAAQSLAKRFERQHPDIRVYLTGPLMLNNAFRDAAIGDIRLFIPLMYAAIVVIMWVSLRSAPCVLAGVAVVLLSVCSGMGLAGWTGFEITAVSASAPTIIMTLAILDSVHILITVLCEMGRGSHKRDAIVYSLKSNCVGIFLTSITTAMGLLAINTSNSPPFRDLGNICALGVASAYLYSMVFLPAFLSVLPVRAGRRKEVHGRAMDVLADFAIGHRSLLLVVFAVLVCGLSACIPLNVLNDHYTMYFDESVQFRRDIDFTTSQLTGMYQIEYALDSGEENGVCNPDYLKTLDAFSAWFAEQPGAIHVDSFSETMKRINRIMLGNDPREYRIPEDRQLAAQYLLLYELSLPFGLDLNHRLNVTKSTTRFVVTMGGVSADELSRAALAGEEWLRRNAPASMFSPGLGPGVMFSRISQSNIRSMLAGTTAELGLISLTLLLFLRSFRVAVISLIPNLVPAAMTFGVWGVTVGRIGLGLSAVVAMTFGIVVDDTIHFLDRYLRTRRTVDASPEDALREAFAKVGWPMFYTSAILVAGFLVLGMSEFRINAAMGRLCAMVIAFALLADYFLLPALLLKFDHRTAALPRCQEDP